MTALLNPIGHNSPPSDAEYLENHLRDVNEPLLNGAQKAEEAANSRARTFTRNPKP